MIEHSEVEKNVPNTKFDEHSEEEKIYQIQKSKHPYIYIQLSQSKNNIFSSNFQWLWGKKVKSEHQSICKLKNILLLIFKQKSGFSLKIFNLYSHAFISSCKRAVIVIK